MNADANVTMEAADAAQEAEAGGREVSVDQMISDLQEDIFAARYRPGDRLDERALAARFGVSRTPVREALRRMSSVGVIELRPNQGAFIAEITPSDIIATVEVNSELKIMAARLAARRMTVAERENLAALIAPMRASVEAGDLKRYFDYSFLMMDAIVMGAHNSYLQTSMDTIQARLVAYRGWLSRVLERPLRTSAEENLAMMEAVVHADAEEAERWMRKHAELRAEELSMLIALMSERVAGDGRRKRPAGRARPQASDGGSTPTARKR